MIHKATEGIKYSDPFYNTRQMKAEKKGLLWGAYHFGTNASGVLQANNFLNKIGNTSKTLLVLNIEPYKKKIMSQQQVEDFIRTVQNKTGKLVMIYGSYYILNKYNVLFFKNNPLWIAHYNKTVKIPSGWNNWVLWQYTDGKRGLKPHTVTGVGVCDRDKFNGSVDELHQFWLKGSLKNCTTVNPMIYEN